jgi:hypothetical protein
MSFFTPIRVDAPELLDEHDAPRAEMERSLRDLRRFNRYLGGIAAFKRSLRLLLGRDWRRSRILDIGTGTSDLLASAGRQGMRIGLDFKIDHLLYGRSRWPDGVHRVVGDARRLPFRDGVVDAITSSHFIHHFTPEENSTMFREALRVARRGIAANDTQRHRVPLSFVQLLAILKLVGPITRADAPASVRRGYTADEARVFASHAGASRVKIFNMFPFRIGILLWK